jgi:peptide/nickel transport system substrate-binding protein
LIIAQRTFGQSPILAQQVAIGELPPVSERIPENPLVVLPVETTGRYGGTIQRAVTGDVIQRTAFNKTLSENLLGYSRPRPDRIELNAAEGFHLSTDGKTAEFKIRRGMRWSDGHPFTVEDILFYYYDMHFNDRARSADFAGPATVWLIDGEPIKLEAIDAYTLRCTARQPIGRIREIFCRNYFAFPKQILKQYHPDYNPEATYADFRNRTTEAQLVMNPEYPRISAWAPSAWVRGQRIVFSRNPYYWKVDTTGNQLPYADRIVFTVIQDRELILLKFINGEIDLFGRFASIDMYPTLKSKESEGIFKLHVNDAGPRSGILPQLGRTGSPPEGCLSGYPCAHRPLPRDQSGGTQSARILEAVPTAQAVAGQQHYLT